MDSKDDRYKSKRSNMKQHKKNHHRPKQTNIATGSSSSQVEGLRSVIDVADSSDDRFSMRSINWSPRAAESELDMDMDNEQMRAGDFGMLSQMPASIGGHFQFTSEKYWDTDDTWINKTEASEYFTLDINLLNAGLQTIPFYKRLDFSSSWFTKSQLKAMNQAAEIAEKNYQSVLKDHENNPRGKVNSASKKGTAQKPPATNDGNESGNGKDNKPENNEKDQELDDLLSLTTSEVAKVSIDDSKNQGPSKASSRPPSSKSEAKAAEPGENTEEIQQWLDNVLEQ